MLAELFTSIPVNYTDQRLTEIFQYLCKGNNTGWSCAAQQNFTNGNDVILSCAMLHSHSTLDA